jgi:peptidoglycan hydrolase FlgJ
MINSISNDLAGTAALNATQNVPVKISGLAVQPQNPELRKAFDSFVGETFFGQLLQSMRKTVDKPAYGYGGRAEEIFQQQLDNVMAKKISDMSADQFSGPMFELFNLQRK